MHGGTAAGAIGIFRLDRHIDVRQVGGQRTTVGATLLGPRLGARRVSLVIGRFLAGSRLLDVFERQVELIGIKLLRAPAELGALQLMQDVTEPIDLRQRLIALRSRRHKQRLKCSNVAGKLGGGLAHAHTETDSRVVVISLCRGDSKVVALTRSRLAAQCRVPAAATNPAHRSEPPAAKRSAASRRR
jgi:hypothetical protein